ncbi:hypothetical protein [Spirillospora sp. CA-294931]|uniref:hypothetical protein n=1 Tax=Spirillospora sp. CA-294931 TaxID=3240042 RepID=UPI003D8E1EBE
MTPVPIDRRTLIAATAAMAAVAAAGCASPSDAVRAAAAERRRPGALAHKGVNYDTERETWKLSYVRRDIKAIRRDLHCNAILLLGSDVRRLMEAARLAAGEGLYVWIEARQFEQTPERTLEFLTEIGRAAEKLRRRHPKVGISVGCELTIFMQGLVPGADWMERGANLSKPISNGYNERLNAFLPKAVKTTREVFGGKLTYSSGEWEKVVWTDFDIVGVDLYRDAKNEATYVRQVRELHSHGKPVFITEFGCCTYKGAEKRGGEGFMGVIDEDPPPPRVKPGFVRDERVQAEHIGELLDIYEAEGVSGAFVYNFSSPDTPHTDDPLYDQDIASHCIVKVRSDYARTGRWEPKLAFHTLARRYA